MKPSFRRLHRAAHRAATTTGLRLALFGVLALLAAWRPLEQAGGLNDFRDSHLLHSYEEAAARTVTRYGQLPLWNPWACGGLYAPGNPQTRVASPTLLLSAALGARPAEPLVLWAFLVLGMEGFFRYARRRTGSALGALAAAPAFGLVGFTSLAWTLGWLNFAGFLLMPWVMLGAQHAARGRVGGVALVAGGFALMLGFGGTYPVPVSALLVTLVSVRELLSRRARGRRLSVILALGATALFTLAACAFRLWPLLETMHSAPRVMAGTPGNSLGTLVRMVLGFPLPPQGNPGSTGDFFLGIPLLVLAALAVLGGRRAVLAAVAAGLLVWLAAGYSAQPSLFAGLRKLPVFSTLRYPERMLFPSAVFLAELAALGVAAVLLRARRSAPWRWAVVAVVGLVLVGWGLQVAAYEMISRRSWMGPMPAEVDQPFAQARGNRWSQGHFLALNRGSIACGEAYPVPMSERLRGDLPQEEYLEDAGSGTARRVEWTPNRLEVDVAAARPTVLLVNQNWHPGWKASVGEVVSRDGLLAVRLPQGEHRVVLRFLPRSGLGGAAVSALAWVGMGLVAWRARRRSGRVGPEALAVAVVPLLAWGALFAGWKEPPAPPVLRNQDGSPLRVEALAENARPVGARFEVPVELVAAEVPEGPDASGVTSLALYWKVTGPVPRSAGIFVHLVGPGGLRHGADHPVVGGTYFLAEAPRGELLRDAFSVSTRDWPPGEWRVLVGLWHAGGDGSRIEVLGADGRPVSEGRVSVGTFTVPAKP